MLGDGIRRSLATVTKEERDLFRDAILQLNQVFYSPAGSRTDFPAGHVSLWFKQDEIHQSSHVHGCPQFLPWHREMCNRFEALLRTIDPRLSLHYWDWTLDPSAMPDGEGGTINLFNADFMGNADATVNGGDVGQPLLGAGFYDPAAVNYRDDISPVNLVRPNLADPTTFSYPDPTVAPNHHYNPADPPRSLKRGKAAGAPPVGVGAWSSDHDLITAPSWEAFRNLMYGDEQGTDFNHGAHGEAHTYIGGDIRDPHLSFRDPFVFLMHSNIDRLWAMWQRQPGFEAQRLDPAQVYGTEENSVGSGDVEFGDPSWGILSPMEPWAGYTAQTPATGQVTSLWPIRPWFAPENEQNLPANNKNAKDFSIVVSPSYDTVPHSSYIITNRDTFSTSEVITKGSPAVFADAFSVVYDGFMPRELGATSTPLPNPLPNLPTFTYTGASNIDVVNPTASYEDPSRAIDMPQRIVIAYDLQFLNSNDFPAASGGEDLVNVRASLNYNIDTGTGGAVVPQTAIASAELVLVNQPNPYMVDTEQGDPSPYWLSVDTRVFQRRTSDSPLAGVTQGDMDTDPNAPFAFIQAVISGFNSRPNDNTHPFLTQLSEDETASQLELSQKVAGQRVYNYAVAKVRYLAPSGVPATNASVFFRVFSTAVAALDYDNTGGLTGNYRRTGNANGGTVPLLGVENDSHGQPETSSMPFFATPRVNTASASMTTQSLDTPNIQPIAGTGSENVAYFGVWLDVNLAPGDPNFRQFPLSPSGVSGWPDGPYSGTLQSLQQLMLGTHHCMVAELFFWPPGTAGDPIPHAASPASSDRLAQRNLVLVASGNPGYPETHTVQHTFVVKPSEVVFERALAASAASTGRAAALSGSVAGARPRRRGQPIASAAIVERRYRGPDELIIRWNNVPRSAIATVYMPEITSDAVIALSRLRQHPAVIEKVDQHTFSCRLSDITFIPLPRVKGTIAGLLSLTLPPGIRTGQVFRFSVEQYSGYTLKTVGAFQMTIPVKSDPEILPGEIRKLSVMKYVHQAIPATSRWHSIFVRYVDQIAARVRGFGGDPDDVEPSPDGGEGDGHRRHPRPRDEDIEPSEFLKVNIPWSEYDIEGELDLKVRFRRKGG
jgi:Common central domain of tyrosinase